MKDARKNPWPRMPSRSLPKSCPPSYSVEFVIICPLESILFPWHMSSLFTWEFDNCLFLLLKNIAFNALQIHSPISCLYFTSQRSISQKSLQNFLPSVSPYWFRIILFCFQSTPLHPPQDRVTDSKSVYFPYLLKNKTRWLYTVPSIDLYLIKYW